MASSSSSSSSRVTRSSLSSPSSSSSSQYRTRGPLVELPLEQFLLPSSSATKHNTGAKRPVSPGNPALYSPAKRRILNDEGLFAEKSPLPASLLPTSLSKRGKTPHQPPPQSRFSDALLGPDSPARKLDFGIPKNIAAPMRSASGGLGEEDKEMGDRRSCSMPVSNHNMRTRSRKHEGRDCFSPADSSQTPPPRSQMDSQMSISANASSCHSSSRSQCHQDYTPVPRELPSPPDPQSVHYPGFVVYQDPHVFVPSLRLTPATSSSSMVLVSLENSLDYDMDAETIDPRETVKENLPPRRKSRKSATAPLPEKTLLFSPPSTKTVSMPATPLGEFRTKDKEVATPRRPSIFGVSLGSGLGRAHPTPSKEERKTMRRILEEEVNEEEDD